MKYYELSAAVNSRLSLLLKQHLILVFLVLTASGIYAQNFTVSGTVSAEGSDESLVGAIIREKDSSNGASTDMNGQFTINVSSGEAILEISYIGYVTKEVPVNGQTNLAISLSLDSSQLEEVVVIDYGYGTVEKEDMTGATASIGAKELSEMPVSSVTDALSGRLPGVNIQAVDGEPGADVSVRVRGGNSITQSSEPVYVVDGFIVSSINDVPPSDIESITVLKDASSTAIYGARGSNGVVVITTKTPKDGKVSINYNNFFQYNQLPQDRKLDVLSPYEFALANYEVAKLRSEADVRNYERYFGSYNDLDLYNYLQPTDWQDELFGGSRLSQFHTLSISGGTEMTKMRLSLSRNGDEGILTGSAYERNALNFKLNQKILDNLSVDLSARITKQVRDGAGTSSNSQLKIKDAVQTRPVNGIADQIEIDLNQVDTDNDFQQFIESLISPTELVKQDWRKRSEEDYLLGAVLNWEVIDNLNFKSQFNANRTFEENLRFYGPLTSESFNNGSSLPLGYREESTGNSYRLVNTLNYDFKVKDDHKFNILVGQEVSSGKGKSNFLRAEEFRASITPEELFANMNLGRVDQQRSGESIPSNTLSILGRLDYQFLERFLGTFTFRADQSSRFTEENNLGVFPGAAIAWQMHEENFLANSGVFDQLMLRLSYGSTGNDRIPNDAKSFLFETQTFRGPGFNNEDNVYYTPSSNILYNPSLKWETSIQRNIGLDFRLFEGKHFGALDFYYNSTNDILLTRAIPTNTGFSFQWDNLGSTTNKGVELGLNSYIVDNNDFTLTARANFGKDIAEIKDLGGVDEQFLRSNWASTDLNNINDYYYKVGGRVGDIYGYVTDGMYGVEDFEMYDEASGDYILKEGVPNSSAVVGNTNIRPGFLKLSDLNQDGVIDANDRQIIGNALPDFQGGVGLNSRWKGFDASIFFEYQYGNDVYNTNKIQLNQFRRITYGNLLETMSSDNRFTYIDVDGSYTGIPGEVVTDLDQLADLNANKNIWSHASHGIAGAVVHSWAIEDGSFFRLSNVSLGYTLPDNLISKIGMNECRIFATGRNLHIWTDYSGFDPQVSSRGRGTIHGLDDSSYPRNRNYSVGINVTF